MGSKFKKVFCFRAIPISNDMFFRLSLSLAAVIFILMLGQDVTAQRARPAGPKLPLPVPQKCIAPNGLTQTEIAAVLRAHNLARAEQKLVRLRWDCRLAADAQAWANLGRFVHRQGSDMGENLFLALNADAAATLAVEQWLSEKPDYDPKTGGCTEGKKCGHYAQVMWRETLLVGCGIRRDVAGEFKVLLVCNYDPAGNGGGPAF